MARVVVIADNGQPFHYSLRLWERETPFRQTALAWNLQH